VLWLDLDVHLDLHIRLDFDIDLWRPSAHHTPLQQPILYLGCKVSLKINGRWVIDAPVRGRKPRAILPSISASLDSAPLM
jgi:hypothetical protein